MNLYISDLHFGHANVINFDNRPFSDAEEMDRALIRLWNSRVSAEDNVYIVGDFCYRSGNAPEWYLRQLKGHKHLIIGNHDGNTLKNETAMSYFESVDKMMHVSDDGRQICLCHFPIAEWNGYYKGSWHIYGHIHKSAKGCYQYLADKRALNAGCMINHYTPATIEQLVKNNQMFRENY